MSICSSSSTTNNRAVGYRFRPTDQELVGVYLSNKILSRDSLVQTITLPEVNNLCELEPWQLPHLDWPPEIDPQNRTWYFFCRRNPNCTRVKRVTKQGFWSVTGDRKKIRDAKTKEEIGFKRIMTFYVKDPVSNKKKKENKTSWVIHEYYLTSNQTYVLCKLKKKEFEAADISSPEGQTSVSLPNMLSPKGQQIVCLPDMSSPEGQQSVCLPHMSSHEAQPSVLDMLSHEGQTSVGLPNMLSPGGQPSVCLPDMCSHEGQPSVCLPHISSQESQPRVLDMSSHEGQMNLENHVVEDQSQEIFDVIEADDLLPPLIPCNQEDVDIQSIVDFDEYDFDFTASNQQNMDFGDGGSDLPFFGAMSPISAESPLKRSRTEDGGLNTGAEAEVFLTQCSWPEDDLASSSAFQQLPAVEVSSTTLSSIQLPVREEFREDTTCISFAANTPYFINNIALEEQEYPVDMRTNKSQYQIKCVNLIEKEPAPETKDKAGDVGEPVTTAYLPHNENAIKESNIDEKTAQESRPKKRLKMHSNGSAGSDGKGPFIFPETSPLIHKPSPPSVYIFNALLGIILFIPVIWDLVMVGGA